MKKDKVKHRQPTVDEQHVLEVMTVRLVEPEEVERFDQLIVEEHYLHNAQLVGERLRYVVTWKGRWLGRDVPEFRRKQALAYPLAGVMALIAMALFSGVAKGYEDLAEYAATLSQAQLRALRFRFCPRTRRIRCPRKSVFERVLAGVDALAVEKVLLLWQQQVLGPANDPSHDPLVVFDGKKIRHADVELVSAVNGQGVWLGTVGVGEGTNEIPAARELLPRLDLTDKIVLADAAHTQVETTRQILFEGGGDYLLTVKNNQKELVKTLEALLAQQSFSPKTHGEDPCLHPGKQSGTP